eukprot:PhF_6_TR23280/c0_g1_i1/m.32779
MIGFEFSTNLRTPSRSPATPQNRYNEGHHPDHHHALTGDDNHHNGCDTPTLPAGPYEDLHLAPETLVPHVDRAAKHNSIDRLLACQIEDTEAAARQSLLSACSLSLLMHAISILTQTTKTSICFDPNNDTIENCGRAVSKLFQHWFVIKDVTSSEEDTLWIKTLESNLKSQTSIRAQLEEKLRTVIAEFENYKAQDDKVISHVRVELIAEKAMSKRILEDYHTLKQQLTQYQQQQQQQLSPTRDDTNSKKYGHNGVLSAIHQSFSSKAIDCALMREHTGTQTSISHDPYTDSVLSVVTSPPTSPSAYRRDLIVHALSPTREASKERTLTDSAIRIRCLEQELAMLRHQLTLVWSEERDETTKRQEMQERFDADLRELQEKYNALDKCHRETIATYEQRLLESHAETETEKQSLGAKVHETYELLLAAQQGKKDVELRRTLEVSELSARIRELENTAWCRDKSQSSLVEDFRAQVRDMEDLDVSSYEHERRIELLELHTKVHEMEKEMKGLEMSLASATSAHQASDAEKERLKEKLAALTHELEETNKELNTKRHSLETCASDMCALVVEKAILVTRLETLSQEKNSVVSQLDTVREDRDGIQRRLSEFENRSFHDAETSTDQPEPEPETTSSSKKVDIESDGTGNAEESLCVKCRMLHHTIQQAWKTLEETQHRLDASRYILSQKDVIISDLEIALRRNSKHGPAWAELCRQRDEAVAVAKSSTNLSQLFASQEMSPEKGEDLVVDIASRTISLLKQQRHEWRHHHHAVDDSSHTQDPNTNQEESSEPFQWNDKKLCELRAMVRHCITAMEDFRSHDLTKNETNRRMSVGESLKHLRRLEVWCVQKDELETKLLLELELSERYQVEGEEARRRSELIGGSVAQLMPHFK